MHCKMCDRPALARGLCRNHYYIARRAGTLNCHDLTRPPLEDRLNGKYEIAESGCWEWMGQKNGYGYGLIWRDGKPVRAHRVMYELHAGKPLGADEVVCHRCDNPKCINPDHLFVGTRADNNADMRAKRRHKFSEAHWNAKLTASDVAEIRNSGELQHVLAAKFGVSQPTIGRIMRGERRILD